jgi:hypothetical protein
MADGDNNSYRKIISPNVLLFVIVFDLKGYF